MISNWEEIIRIVLIIVMWHIYEPFARSGTDKIWKSGMVLGKGV